MDAEPGRDALVVMEHQLPEMEIQQEITDINQISRIPQNRMGREMMSGFLIKTAWVLRFCEFSSVVTI